MVLSTLLLPVLGLMLVIVGQWQSRAARADPPPPVEPPGPWPPPPLDFLPPPGYQPPQGYPLPNARPPVPPPRLRKRPDGTRMTVVGAALIALGLLSVVLQLIQPEPNQPNPMNDCGTVLDGCRPVRLT